MTRLLLVLLVAFPVLADDTYDVAKLVTNSNDAALTEPLTVALRSQTPLVRATASRVVAVRGLSPLLPIVRESLATESDATAAREHIRALGLLGSDDDLALAVQSASRWPVGMDNALAVAVARRGPQQAVEKYLGPIRQTRMTNFIEFFRVALWGHGDLIAFAGSRLLSKADAKGWEGLLGALRESSAAMNAGVMASSLGSSLEEIRFASVRYLVRSYAFDPSVMDEIVKNEIAKERGELSSDRVDFGFELLHRMLGGERKDDPRWLKFLDTTDADHLLGSDEDVLQYLTPDEYRVRYNRCEIQTRECELPQTKPTKRTIPSQIVAPPVFNLPALLPAGLADAIMKGTKCRDAWLGVAEVGVDQAGRTRTLDLQKVGTAGGCKDAIEILLRLALATNTSLRSGFTGPVLLVHPPRASLCLDEGPPATGASLLHVGGEVEAPKVLKRVEPVFPETARRAMGGGTNVLVVLECVISKDGCVRSVQLIKQSPYPELNGAAVMAVSQWKFRPGQLDGEPVDVIFHLTVNFKAH